MESLARAVAAEDAERDKLRSPLGDPDTVVTRVGRTDWKVETVYYIDSDGLLSSRKPWRTGDVQTEVYGVYEVEYDPESSNFVSTFPDGGIRAYDSFSTLIDALAEGDNIDHGKPGVKDGAIVPFDATADPLDQLGKIVEDPSYDPEVHAALTAARKALDAERANLLADAKLYAPGSEDGA
jgi:hypothetical protein